MTVWSNKPSANPLDLSSAHLNLSSFSDFLSRQAPELLPGGVSHTAAPGAVELPHGTTIVAARPALPEAGAASTASSACTRNRARSGGSNRLARSGAVTSSGIPASWMSTRIAAPVAHRCTVCPSRSRTSTRRSP